jgi:drug/metabolite transporter (DMT)-like permease
MIEMIWQWPLLFGEMTNLAKWIAIAMIAFGLYLMFDKDQGRL